MIKICERLISEIYDRADLSRRRNEHKTRPCSLVLMRRPVPACSPATSFFVLSSFPALFLFVLLCLHQRRHAEVAYFPWAVQVEWKSRLYPTGKASQHARHCFNDIYVCIYIVYMYVYTCDKARAVHDIDSVCQRCAEGNNQLCDYRSRLNYLQNFPAGYCVDLLREGTIFFGLT